ncbi:hypothetical protein [Pontibacter virosus]|uniref:Uncharacterized protein n=1 Tax=Pontibacter virosus TaxID=1765052 RepID=A0A2U1B2Q1_9BACT|nr:hypothetical protein [Pontibacter virosus]PVY42928.1 hypothetical protein C8E01_102104 [Pontibacter virosus]
MKSAIAVFFASLVSGALSFADFRPTLSDLVQILTGVQITEQTQQESEKSEDCATVEKSEEQRLYLSSDTNRSQDLPCADAAYEQGAVYIL